MPKMKTKSGAKKRFKLTASGKVKAGQAGKQHGMIKRSNKQIRDKRGTKILAESDARVIRKKLSGCGITTHPCKLRVVLVTIARLKDKFRGR